MEISFLDLAGQHRALASEIRDALARVLEESTFILGEEVERFEQEFADYCGARHCVAVNSGTSALHLALLGLGVKSGDEVLTAPSSYIATAEAISYTGARPVFADVQPDSLNLNPERVAAAITPETKAIIPVHLFGQPADMASILELADRHGLVVVEDACQAHGAVYRGRRVGTLGAAGCFSFYPSKNLGACGEGGAVVTDDDALCGRMRMLRNHGQSIKDRHEVVGFNYRMEGFQAAILRLKLQHLEEWIEVRWKQAQQYDRLLEGSGVVIPGQVDQVRHVYHLYVIQSHKRDDLRRHLASLGVNTAIHYPYPIHLQPAYRHLGYRPGSFPAAEAAATKILSLPLYPGLTEAQLCYVAEGVRSFSKVVG